MYKQYISDDNHYFTKFYISNDDIDDDDDDSDDDDHDNDCIKDRYDDDHEK